MACGTSTAKSHNLCTVVFVYTLIYDRIEEKYDDLRPYTESVTVDLGGQTQQVIDSTREISAFKEELHHLMVMDNDI